MKRVETRKMWGLIALAGLVVLGLLSWRTGTQSTSGMAAPRQPAPISTLDSTRALAPDGRQVRLPSQAQPTSPARAAVYALSAVKVPSLPDNEVIDAEEMEARMRTSARFCQRAFNAGTTELLLVSPAAPGAMATWEITRGDLPDDAKICLDDMLQSLPDATMLGAPLVLTLSIDKVTPAKAYPYR